MRILVTAGPTREAIDPVRFISNRSSGRMGYAIAAAAAGRGHEARLISGPVALAAPHGVRVARVTTAAEMFKAVKEQAAWCDALIMAAAVCDWRPATASRTKLKKAGIPRSHSLPLRRTADILQGVAGRKGRRIFVGFAAETGNLLAEARRKLKLKKLDLIVANNVSLPDAGFEANTNRALFVEGGGDHRQLPLMTKRALAREIIRWVEDAAARPDSA